MLFVSGVVVFALSWWVVFFMLLPLGVTVEEAPEAGHAPSAPQHPYLARKMLGATIIAALLTTLAVVAVQERWIPLEEWLGVNSWDAYATTSSSD